MAFNTSKDALVSGEGQIVVLDSEFTTEADKTSPLDEVYHLMLVYGEVIVTFEAQWETTTSIANDTEGEWITFTSKTLQPGNYPRKIKNIIIIDGLVLLEK